MEITFSDIKKITLEKVKPTTMKYARDNQYAVIVLEEYSGEKHEINVFGTFEIENQNRMPNDREIDDMAAREDRTTLNFDKASGHDARHDPKLKEFYDEEDKGQTEGEAYRTK